MKKTLAILALLACALGTNAQSLQDITDSGTNRARFGVRIAWDLNSPSTSLNKFVSTYHNGSGFSAGAFYSLPLVKNLYFEPGLGVFYNTMLISQNIADNIQLDYPLTPEGSLRNSGLRIPLVFGYRFDFTDDISISFFTGPQVNVGLSLKQFDNFTHTGRNLYNAGWRRVDGQWLFGLRFYYSDNWIAEISGGIGATSMIGGDKYKGEDFRRNTFSISVGYMF